MKHTLQRIFCALILLFGGTVTSAGEDLRIALSAEEVSEVVRASSSYLFIGSELSPLANVINKIAPLATAEEKADALKALASRFAKNNKTASQEIVRQALEEATLVLEKHHDAIADDEELRAIAQNITECKDLLSQEALLITVQTDSELRAPRPALEPGGLNPLPGIGSQVNPDELYPLARDVNVDRNLHVGGDLVVDGTITGTIVGTTIFHDDIILEPIAPDTDIAILFHDNAANELARIETTPGGLQNGLVIKEAGVPYIHHTGPTPTTNIFVGNSAGNLTVTGGENAGFGVGALLGLTSGTFNTAVGRRALQAATTGANNTALGARSGLALTTGTTNTIVGTDAAMLLNGSNNVIVGYNAGATYTTASNNICIGKDAAGVAAETNTIRLGAAAHTSTYITGVNVSDGATNLNIVGIDTNNKLATSTTGVFSLNGNMLIPGIDTFHSITLNTGVANSGILYTNKFAPTFDSTDFDRINLAFNYYNTTPNGGPASETIPNAGFGTAQVTLGADGTGGAIVMGTSSAVNTAPTPRMTVRGSGIVDFYNNIHLDATTVITEGALSNRYIHHTGPTPATNIFVGDNAGNTNVLLTGGNNSGFGVGSLIALTTGTDNTACGKSALPALTTGTANTIVGTNAALLLNGSNNVIVGYNAGATYTTASNNICIGKDAAGVAAETNTIRLGAAAHTSTYITGVHVSDGATALNVVGIDVNHKLATSTTGGFTLTGDLNTTGNIVIKSGDALELKAAGSMLPTGNRTRISHAHVLADGSLFFKTDDFIGNATHPGTGHWIINNNPDTTNMVAVATPSASGGVGAPIVLSCDTSTGVQIDVYALNLLTGVAQDCDFNIIVCTRD